MADRKLRIGIIGTGGIARSHLNAYLNQPDVEIVAGADIVPGKAAAFFAGTVGAGAWGAEKSLSENKALEGVRSYDDHVAMLEAEELDAVSVCTYNTAHAECSINALNRGLHVLLEKPMCVTTEEAVAICKAEKASGKVLSIGFQPRFDENMKMIKKIVDSGALGRVYYIQTGGGRRRGIPGSTFIEKSTGGIGALGDIGCYSLDMVLNAIGYPKPLTVSGYISDFFGKNPKYYAEHARFSVDDFGAAFVRLEGGVILDFRISWAIHADTPGDTILFGTDGALRIPSTDCWNGSVGGPMTLYHDIAGKQTETTIPLQKNDKNKGDLWNQKIRSFLNACINNTESPVPSSQILINQAIIDGIMKSAQAGKEIAVEIPEI
ncbi:MAG: Gfo/Idh/MocA family oxidoreductase [Firmicutes bacterium]|nr:Gfo/Idh/MocA family oxidoreductase [Bacillota bacterium]